VGLLPKDFWQGVGMASKSTAGNFGFNILDEYIEGDRVDLSQCARRVMYIVRNLYKSTGKRNLANLKKKKITSEATKKNYSQPELFNAILAAINYIISDEIGIKVEKTKNDLNNHLDDIITLLKTVDPFEDRLQSFLLTLSPPVLPSSSAPSSLFASSSSSSSTSTASPSSSDTSSASAPSSLVASGAYSTGTADGPVAGSLQIGIDMDQDEGDAFSSIRALASPIKKRNAYSLDEENVDNNPMSPKKASPSKYPSPNSFNPMLDIEHDAHEQMMTAGVVQNSLCNCKISDGLKVKSKSPVVANYSASASVRLCLSYYKTYKIDRSFKYIIK